MGFRSMEQFLLRPQNGWPTGLKGPKFHTLILEDLTCRLIDGKHLPTPAFWMQKCLAFFKPSPTLRERLEVPGLCQAIGEPTGIKIGPGAVEVPSVEGFLLSRTGWSAMLTGKSPVVTTRPRAATDGAADVVKPSYQRDSHRIAP